MLIKKPHLGNLALLLGSVAFSLLCGELALRAASPRYFELDRNKYDPDLGWIGAPHHQSYSDLYGIPFTVQINSLGFRDLDHPVEKIQRVKRIAVLGDSFVEGIQVALEDTFWKRTAASMQMRFPQDRWEALGFGVGNYGLLQESMVLERFVPRFRPDALILQIFPLNDISNASIAMEPVGGPEEIHRPYLVPAAEPGEWKVTYTQPIRSTLRRYSYLYRYLSLWLAPPPTSEAAIRQMDRNMFNFARQHGMKEHQGNGYNYIRLNTFARTHEQFAFTREGWDRMEASLHVIGRRSVFMNLPLLVVVIPSEPEVARVGGNTREFGYEEVYGLAEERIRKAMLHYPRSRVVHLAERFRKERNRLLPYIHGHLTKVGHEIVAEEVTKELAELLK